MIAALLWDAWRLHLLNVLSLIIYQRELLMPGAHHVWIATLNGLFCRRSVARLCAQHLFTWRSSTSLHCITAGPVLGLQLKVTQKFLLAWRCPERKFASGARHVPHKTVVCAEAETAQRATVSAGQRCNASRAPQSTRRSGMRPLYSHTACRATFSWASSGCVVVGDAGGRHHPGLTTFTPA